MDITWIDVGEYGMYYATNVIDYATRFPVASVFSSTHTTQDVISVLEMALEEARRLRGELPEQIILVSDNGPQFVSKRFRKWLTSDGVPFKHVRGRAHHPQSIGMVERYHQSLKYEEIWINDYDDPIEARKQNERYRQHYAFQRPHQALDYGVPADLYISEQSGDSLRISA